jgi:tetratricopeptide (TPR) repeat protein
MFYAFSRMCRGRTVGSTAVASIMLVGFCSGCGHGGRRTTVMLGEQTLDPNVHLTAVQVRSTSESEESSRGVEYLVRGDYSRAANALDGASRSNPDDHNSIFLAAVAYEKLGKNGEACSRYKRAESIQHRGEYMDGEYRVCEKDERG